MRVRSYTIGGKSVPPEVVEQVFTGMRGISFCTADVDLLCQEALRKGGHPVSVSYTLAERIMRDCRESGLIEVAVSRHFNKVWRWRDSA